MSVFYFHVRRGDVIYLDHKGVDLIDLRSAWSHALADSALLFGRDRNAPDIERWIEIDDPYGHIVSTAPVGTVIQ